MTTIFLCTSTNQVSTKFLETHSLHIYKVSTFYYGKNSWPFVVSQFPPQLVQKRPKSAAQVVLWVPNHGDNYFLMHIYQSSFHQPGNWAALSNPFRVVKCVNWLSLLAVYVSLPSSLSSTDPSPSRKAKNRSLLALRPLWSTLLTPFFHPGSSRSSKR